MAGWTNRGKKRILNGFFRNTDVPTFFYLALITDAVVPTQDHNTFGQLTEITAGNGYATGGYQLNRNTTDFDTLTEDDGNDRALVQIKDASWLAAGGAIPPGGDPASYVVLTDDDAVIADREVLAYWSLGGDRTVSDGQTLTVRNAELRLNEV